MSVLRDAGGSTPQTPPSRAILLGTAASVLATTAHTTFMYYLAPVALRAAGIEGSDWVLFTLVAVAMGATVIPAGQVSDRIPRRYAMRIGLALLAASYVTLLLPVSLAGLAVGASLSGIGLGFQIVSFASYVADLLAATHRTGAYGRATALGVLASAAGPFLAALVFDLLDAGRTGLVVNAALFAGLALLGIGATMGLPRMRHEGPGPVPGPAPGWRAIAKAATPVAAMYLLMGAGYGMTSPYFTVYFLDHLSFAPDTWGYVLAAGTVLSALGAASAGRFAVAPLVLGSQGGLLLAHAAFVLPMTSPLALGAAFLVRSACQSAVAPAMNAATASRAPPGAHARTQAVGSLAWNLGWASGALAGGRILATGGAVLFPVGGVLAMLGAVVGVALLRDNGGK